MMLYMNATGGNYLVKGEAKLSRNPRAVLTSSTTGL